MGKKIITVDLNFPSETQAVEDQEEVNDPPPGDEYAAVKEEASLEPSPSVELTPLRPKPKRKPAPKKVIPVDEPPLEEPPLIVEPPLMVEEAKAVPPPGREETQKVKCHHCNKEMTMKSLKYSHSRNCLGLKKTIDKVSNEKVSQKREIEPPLPCEEAPPPPPIVPVRTQENPREERMNALKERYNNLVKNALN